jgi:hypothetical protein
VADRLSPHDIWIQAGRETTTASARSKRYAELLVKHGHVLPNPPCPLCGERFRHRHAFVDGADRIIRLDIFGHDLRG